MGIPWGVGYFNLGSFAVVVLNAGGPGSHSYFAYWLRFLYGLWPVFCSSIGENDVVPWSFVDEGGKLLASPETKQNSSFIGENYVAGFGVPGLLGGFEVYEKRSDFLHFSSKTWPYFTFFSKLCILIIYIPSRWFFFYGLCFSKGYDRSTYACSKCYAIKEKGTWGCDVDFFWGRCGPRTKL